MLKQNPQLEINLQLATKVPTQIKLPSVTTLRKWIITAFNYGGGNFPDKCAVITVRIVDEDESAKLNYLYRKKTGSTNILSFTYMAEPISKTPFTGDLVICLPKVIKEAKEQDKTFDEHFAHLIIHGTLHLLGFDHQKLKERKRMEDLEDEILAQL